MGLLQDMVVEAVDSLDPALFVGEEVVEGLEAVLSVVHLEE